MPQKHVPILQNISQAPFDNTYRTPEVVGPDHTRVYPRQTYANRQISTKWKPHKWNFRLHDPSLRSFRPIAVPIHPPQAPQTARFNQAHQQICVTSLQSKPPNDLRVKTISSLVSETGKNTDQIKSQENPDLKIDKEFLKGDIFTKMRDNRTLKKKRKLDEKYKRFSLNNLEEFKNSMVDLFDFSSPKERPQPTMFYCFYHVITVIVPMQ